MIIHIITTRLISRLRTGTRRSPRPARPRRPPWAGGCCPRSCCCCAAAEAGRSNLRSRGAGGGGLACAAARGLTSPGPPTPARQSGANKILNINYKPTNKINFDFTKSSSNFMLCPRAFNRTTGGRGKVWRIIMQWPYLELECCFVGWLGKPWKSGERMTCAISIGGLEYGEHITWWSGVSSLQ